MMGVDVDMKEPREPQRSGYQPEKHGWMPDRHVWFSGAVFSVLSGICLLVAWHLGNKFAEFDQSGSLAKFIIGHAVTTVCGLFIITGLVQYADLKTKGALMRGVLHSPIACAIYLAALVIVGGLIWVNYQ